MIFRQKKIEGKRRQKVEKGKKAIQMSEHKNNYYETNKNNCGDIVPQCASARDAIVVQRLWSYANYSFRRRVTEN